MHLEIDRRDIRTIRLNDASIPELADGDVKLRLDEFALTSNNISYALSGDLLDYWGFFPTESGWGRLPVMGHGTVTESRHPHVEVGTRYFGFFPAGDFHVVHAEPTSSGFLDVGTHREKHAMAYRTFDRVSTSATPDDHSILLLRGLFITSFLAEDFLFDNGMFGAGQIVVSSASSKTSIALAHCIRKRGNTHCVALTSPSNIDFVNMVNLYDEVATYDDVPSLTDWTPTVFVDMAGNASVTRDVHTHFGDSLMYSCSIGATHWDQSGSRPELPGPRPQFFFAPSQLAKRGKEWGRDALNERMNSALAGFIAESRRWLDITHTTGAHAVTDTYSALVSGSVDPRAGHILTF